MDRAWLITSIQKYVTPFEEEDGFIKLFLELLKHPRAFYRDHLPGHITGSAWIVDETRTQALLTHHAKLSRWLQPGGHADGEENIIEVALREAREETGLTSLEVISPAIFDLDIHLIPARHDFLQHQHFDVRILLQASRNERFTVTEESHDLAWVSLDEVGSRSNQNPSMLRMCTKTKLL